ncbi:MAG: hypothetical protein DWC06_02520 [Candidatus Poseidoniales archaeon]|nr:MAG: hypothetical protein DWC06_02520 [Candidatus Poseidoniales archaeon]
MFPEWITVLARDHQSDVLRLNDSLKLRGDSLLDPEVPPHTFVGDIKRMKTNDCVLLLGINPKRNHDEKFQRVNLDLPKKCISNYHQTKDGNSLQELWDFQTNYFLRDERNRTYFNKYGDWLGKNWFRNTYDQYGGNEAKQMVCHRHLIEVDTVQYFSHKTGLNPEILADLIESDPALIANMKMIETIIEKIQPRWIQITGKSGWTIVERLFGIGEFTETNPGLKKGTEIRMGYLKIGERITPVLMHKFFGSMAGINSNVEKEQVAKAWDEWMISQNL